MKKMGVVWKIFTSLRKILLGGDPHLSLKKGNTMKEYFMARWTGSGKKVRGRPYRVFLHGTFFYLQRKVKLNETFIAATHIDDPAIFEQVVSAMRELYGLHITRYGDKESSSVIRTVNEGGSTPESTITPDE
jgi:hypothetical protein